MFPLKRPKRKIYEWSTCLQLENAGLHFDAKSAASCFGEEQVYFLRTVSGIFLSFYVLFSALYNF